MYEINDFTNWITFAESGYGKVKPEYGDAREYYEDEQSPSSVPSGKDYIQENIITDTIDRAVGQLVSGEIRASIKGGGAKAVPLKELHDEIYDDNDFKTKIVPKNANQFYCEGLSGWKFVENPYKVGRFGIGRGEIYALLPGELLLDTNTKDGMHDDDLFRIHYKQELLKNALEKFGRNPSGSKNKKWNEITESTANQSGVETERHVDIYEIEFRNLEFVQRTTSDGRKYREEKDVYYQCIVINKTVLAREPKPTGYPTFRIGVMIHTPRYSVSKGRLPMGLVKKLKQTQDQLNVTSSVMLEAVKASIKQLVFGIGLMEGEDAILKHEAAKTNGVFTTRNPQAKINVEFGNPIAPALVQWHDLSRSRFDDIRGSSNQAQQFQSAAAGQLSGKAIGQLSFAGVLPEYTKKTNIQASYKDLSRCIIHYITTKMKHPFSIKRKIDGAEKEIGFNKMAAPGYEGDQYNIVEDNVVNDLSNIAEGVDIDIEIEMNMIQKQEMEMNKALLLAQMQKIADKDLLKKMYPYDWKEMHENIVAQGGAMALVQRMAEQGPEFVQMVSQMLDKYATLEPNQAVA